MANITGDDEVRRAELGELPLRADTFAKLQTVIRAAVAHADAVDFHNGRGAAETLAAYAEAGCEFARALRKVKP